MFQGLGPIFKVFQCKISVLGFFQESPPYSSTCQQCFTCVHISDCVSNADHELHQGPSVLACAG